MNEQIGYPDMLTNPAELNQEYIMLNVTHGQFLVNILNVLHYEAYHNFQNLRQPVNRDKWSTEHPYFRTRCPRN
ncbi:neprilysin-1-like [Frankliniella occidentalis]|uniref:Neprilysin-1-like n=1 Tax=Frankliniella occidentalis TaxID=133901 RepID=A0A9C6XTC8_FRAOC|nr:neprilysin-1-like [Frankliniella occidentalis]